MKKTLLSLSALFAVSIASAQSYISQPDPSTYEVRKYQAPQNAQKPVLDKIQETPVATPATDGQPTMQKATPAQAPAATVTAQSATKQPVTADEKKVAENRKK